MFPRLSSTQFLFVVIFLLIYGLAIFWMTREHYRSEAAVIQATVPAPSPQGNSLADTIKRMSPAKKGRSGSQNYDPAVLAQQANDLFTSRQFPEAAAAYRRLLEIDAKNVEHYNNLGLTLQYIGSSNEALKVLEKGTEISPDFQRIWLTLGFVRANTGLYADARTAFDRVAEIDPESEIAKEAIRMRNQLP